MPNGSQIMPNGLQIMSGDFGPNWASIKITRTKLLEPKIHTVNADKPANVHTVLFMEFMERRQGQMKDDTEGDR